MEKIFWFHKNGVSFEIASADAVTGLLQTNGPSSSISIQDGCTLDQAITQFENMLNILYKIKEIENIEPYLLK